jgi:hypothetical protein
MDLESQVAEARRTISADGYPMSIGELTNLYRDDELIIRPEFQRFFRWSNEQRSRLVESLLLGIPLPSVFVAQQDQGKWELVDGLQRLSTILELQGELRDEAGKKKPELTLSKTKFLSDLENQTWSAFSSALRLDVKRAKIDVKIIKRESSPQTKYDLFQRLNSYGSALTSQEMRSALLVAVSSDFFTWLESLAAHQSFVETTSLSERLLEERYDLELVVRFLVLHDRPSTKLTLASLRDFPQVLDDESVGLAVAYPADAKSLEKVFKSTFDLVAANGASDVFRRWDPKKKVFSGSFLNSAFEIIALGLGYRVANKLSHRTDLLSVAKELWRRTDMESGFSTGRSTEARLKDFVPLGRELLKP